MKIYIKNHPHNAGYWIYNLGYKSAWEAKGLTPVLFNKLSDIPKDETDYYVMALDSDIESSSSLEILAKAKRGWLYVQPTYYPGKWGKSPFYLTSCSSSVRGILGKINHLRLWSYLSTNQSEQIFAGWDNQVFNVPLAFDDINYLPLIKPVKTKYVYDVCYIGGRANNGFDEKFQLMQKVFAAFETSGLNTGFFIDRSLTLEDETNLLFHSGVGLNVHDVFQQLYGFDTNERTFKTLGLNGALVSDSVKQLQTLFPNVVTSNDPSLVYNHVKEFLQLTTKEKNDFKQKNKQEMIENHTYKNRVETLLSL